MRSHLLDSGYGADLPPGQRSPATWAASHAPSRGRRHVEPECPKRSPFQRDRDRIIHATSFRRLTHKTQVFVFHEGDHYRTRLTHTLEVAQIARAIARQLRLDEDLAETVALAHDLGHPPFGHAGERALDSAMRPWGGFDHNAQSFRVITQLERMYLAFDGLNPTWETLEGLIKHNGPVAADDTLPARKVAGAIETWRPLDLDRWPSAEAQAAAVADDIAYVNHDIDDGLRAGLIVFADILGAPLVGDLARDVLAVSKVDLAETDEARLTHEITRRSIALMVNDVVTEARKRLSTTAPADADAIRGAGAAIVELSPTVAIQVGRLKGWLFERIYRHQRTVRVMQAAETVVGDLFVRYLRDGEALPPTWRAAYRSTPEHRRPRLVADFVAGMTDRYASMEHERLFDATPELR